MEALILANNAHEEDAGPHKVGSHRRVYGGLRSHTFEELANFWMLWSEYDWPIEHAVTWADVESNIVVKGLQLLQLPVLGRCLKRAHLYGVRQ